MDTNPNTAAPEHAPLEPALPANASVVPNTSHAPRVPKSGIVQVSGEYHDISVAVMMAMFLPGTGQLYNGQTVKGVALILLTFAGLFGVTAWPNRFTLWFGGVGEMVIWLGGIFDAAIIARRLRRGQVITVWKWF